VLLNYLCVLTYCAILLGGSHGQLFCRNTDRQSENQLAKYSLHTSVGDLWSRPSAILQLTD